MSGERVSAANLTQATVIESRDREEASSRPMHTERAAPVSAEDFERLGSSRSPERMLRPVSPVTVQNKLPLNARIEVAAVVCRTGGDPYPQVWFPKAELLPAVLGYGSVNQSEAPLKGTLNFNPLARGQLEALLAREEISDDDRELLVDAALQLTAPAHVELRLRISTSSWRERSPMCTPAT
jgi:hypothetical protein